MKNIEHQEKSLPSCASLTDIVHSLQMSSFMEKKAQLTFHKQVIFIGATFRALCTIKGVLAKDEFKNSKQFFDGGMAKEWSADPLEIPLGPMTRARAKRFKEAHNVLI